MGFVFGFVLNPKKFQIGVALSRIPGDVSVRSVFSRAIASGYYDPSRFSQGSLSARITGYPRVHLPDGVEESLRKTGWGAALYTALCLGAHLTYNDDIDLAMGMKGDGISSAPSPDAGARSPDAAEWWRKAVAERGMAEYVQGCDVTEGESHIDEASDAPEGPVAKKVTSLVKQATKHGELKLKSYSLSASYEFRDEHEPCVRAEAYPYRKAIENNLVIAKVPSMEWDSAMPLYEIDPRELGSLAKPVSLDVILSIDVSYLADNEFAEAAFQRVLRLAELAGAEGKQLDDMKLRFQNKIDVYTPNEKRRVVTHRNRGRRVLIPNPSREVAKSVEELAERREALGYDKFEDE